MRSKVEKMKNVHQLLKKGVKGLQKWKMCTICLKKGQVSKKMKNVY